MDAGGAASIAPLAVFFVSRGTGKVITSYSRPLRNPPLHYDDLPNRFASSQAVEPFIDMFKFQMLAQ
jgi:hypothetical protein